ncbi:MAG: right-handed parallel beta-helix repeat-containing protein [Bacteroidales bacterium]|nr:right-handed parallel beta-helix repeat-containing protein [Bacteroidales bacterium]
MKNFTIILILSAFVLNANSSLAQTNIPADSDIYGTWDLAGSPYLIHGQATIPLDSTLTIEPGVEIRLKTGTEFNYVNGLDCGWIDVRGQIIADGTAQDPITFTRFGDYDFWGNIILSSLTDYNIFNFCKVEYGNKIEYYEGISNQTIYGAISSLNSAGIVTNSNISNNNTSGIYIKSNTEVLQISNSDLYNNGYGITSSTLVSSDTLVFNNDILNNGRGIWVMSGNVVIVENNIKFNGTGIDCNDGGAVILNNIISNNNDGISVDQTYAEIRTNEISHNEDNGIILRWCVPLIISNQIFENDAGIYSYEAAAKIYNNIIFKNVIAYYGYGGSEKIINNTIFGNTDGGVYSYVYGLPLVQNCILWENGTDIGGNSVIDLQNSIIQSPLMPSNALDRGGNILGLYPNFADTTSNNFQILSGSPAIDAGAFNSELLDTIDYASNPRLSHGRIDMGAYEFQQAGDWIHVHRPNQQEFLESETIDTIKWIRSDSLINVQIEYTLDGGDNWINLIASTENDGEFTWVSVPEINTCQSKIRITDINNPLIYDTSDFHFNIATTLIRDEELVFGTWSLANSPYTIERKAIIPAGQSLTIEPGVEVLFKTGRNYMYNSSSFNMGILNVKGELIAEGTAENPILFTHLCGNEFWGMIYFDPVSEESSIIKNCIIEYSSPIYTNDIFYGAVSFNSSGATIENCEFLLNNYFGIDNSYSATPTILNNKFYFNLLGGGIYCWNSDEVDIINNLFFDNLGTGVQCYSSSPNIINNTFSTTGYKKDILSLANPLMSFIENDSLKLSQKSKKTLGKLSKKGVENGKNITYGLLCESYSDPVIYNSIFYNNGTNFNISSNSNPSIGYSLISDAGIPAGLVDIGNNLLNKDPKFKDTDLFDFSLKGISVCINSGTPDTIGLNVPDLDLAKNTRIFNDTIDIGAYEFQDLQGFRLNLKAFLEGPFNGLDMNTDLNTGMNLPLSHPYSTSPWNYNGTESVTSIPNSNIVDWVLIELKDIDDAQYAASSCVIARIAAFILKDGSIVDKDGFSNLEFNNYINQNLFTTLWHRNHIGIMSAFPVSETSGIYSYDFTSGANQAHGGISAHKEVASGIWGTIGGNSSPDNQINNLDKDEGWLSEIGSNGYYIGDMNMDGIVNNTDKENIWEDNAGNGSILYDINSSPQCCDILFDERDGQTYNLVKIGTQCWMAENLNIGIMINGFDNQINNDTIEKYCYNNDTNHCATYGGLYQWDEIMNYETIEGAKGICPDGWHVPTDEEYKMLEGAVDSQYGYPDPEWNETGWRGTDAGTNLRLGGSSGFNALYSGRRNWNGYFSNMGGNIWLRTSSLESNAWGRRLTSHSSSNFVERSGYNISEGHSLRCIRD